MSRISKSLKHINLMTVRIFTETGTIFLTSFYENYDVNTPPFMAGMKRHPFKTIKNRLNYLHGDQKNQSCGL